MWVVHRTYAASRPTRVKGGRRTRLAAQDRPTPEGVRGKGLAPTHGASTQSTRQHATTPPTEGEREGERTTTTRPMDSHRPRRRRLLSKCRACPASGTVCLGSAAWVLSSSAADKQPHRCRSERHKGQRRQRGHRRHEARRRGGAAHGKGHSPCGRPLSCRRGTVLMYAARADTYIIHASSPYKCV